MERVRELLEQVSTLSLATVSPDGTPHAAPVYFAADDDLNLYFFSEARSLHSQHIEQNPQVAATIYPECEGWRDIRGLQIRGAARMVESKKEWTGIWERYQLKFPFVAALQGVVAKNQLYALIPNWICLVDNSRGFGYKKEWNLE